MPPGCNPCDYHYHDNDNDFDDDNDSDDSDEAYWWNLLAGHFLDTPLLPIRSLPCAQNTKIDDLFRIWPRRYS